MNFFCTTCNNPDKPEPDHQRYDAWLKHLVSSGHQKKFLTKCWYPGAVEKFRFLEESSYVIAGIPRYVAQRDPFMYELVVWASEFGLVTEFIYCWKEECFLVTVQGAGLLGPNGPAIERAESLAKERRYKNFCIRVFRKHLMTPGDWNSIVRGTLAKVLREEARVSGLIHKSDTLAKMTSKRKELVGNKENFNYHSVTSTLANDVVDAQGSQDGGRGKSDMHRKNAKEFKTVTRNATSPQEPRQSQQVDAGVPEVKLCRDKYDGPGHRSGRDRTSKVIISPSANRHQLDHVVIEKFSVKEQGDSSVKKSTSTAMGKIQPAAEIPSEQRFATGSKETVAISELKVCEATTDPATSFQKVFKVSAEALAEDSTSTAIGKIEPAAEIPSEQRVAAGSKEAVAISELEGCEATTDPATLAPNLLKVSAKDSVKESSSVVAKSHPIEPAAQIPSQQRDDKETKDGKVVTVKRSEDASHLVPSARNLSLKVSVDPVAENTSVTTTKETQEVVDVQPLCEAEVPAKEEEPDYMQYALYWYRF